MKGRNSIDGRPAWRALTIDERAELDSTGRRAWRARAIDDRAELESRRPRGYVTSHSTSSETASVGTVSSAPTRMNVVTFTST